MKVGTASPMSGVRSLQMLGKTRKELEENTLQIKSHYRVSHHRREKSFKACPLRSFTLWQQWWTSSLRQQPSNERVGQPLPRSKSLSAWTNTWHRCNERECGTPWKATTAVKVVRTACRVCGGKWKIWSTPLPFLPSNGALMMIVELPVNGD
jgi:hypothetical protein